MPLTEEDNVKLGKRNAYVAGAGALLVAATVGIGGCSQKAQEPFRDAPQDGTHDRTSAKVIEMPDGFSNLATKCVGGVRYTVAFKANDNRAAISTLGGDNGCPK